VGIVLVLALLGPTTARANAAAAQTCDASAYTLALQSLTNPPQAELTIRITASVPECALPATLTSVQATVGSRRIVLNSVPSPLGVATVRLGRVARRQVVAATVTFDPQITLSGQTRTLLRPDLVLTSVKSNKVSLSGRPFFVVANIRNPTPDTGTTATVTVNAGGTVVGTQVVAVGARGRTRLNVPVTLQLTGRTRLVVTITAANPRETTTRNNTRRVTVEVAEFKLVRSAVVVPAFAGYGGQFNHHVYAELSRSVGVTDQNVIDMERKMRALHPQFSRIFFNPNAFNDADKMRSFIRTVQFAQSTGTTINITWQGGTFQPQRFADVLLDLVRNRGITHLRWITLQNEPNRTRITMEAYEKQYRDLDPLIQSIRGQVRYMGGDLVRGPDVGPPNQQAWFDYMAAHMADLLDAYSIHVFWDYWDTQKLVDRLTEVRAIVDALPEAGRKPLYVTEYGVRGIRRLNGVAQGDPGVWDDGTEISRTNVSAFQHAWFDLLAARLGYLGTSKWDSYFAKYDNSTQAYYMIGSPQEGWPLYPLYNFVRLMTAAVKPGWKVVNVDSVPDTSRLLAGYVGPQGQLAVAGLDTAGAQLNRVSPTQVAYTIAGLPPSRKLRLSIWNAVGDGLVGPARTVTADSVGVATIVAPQQAVYVLTSPAAAK
jgi:hypothetical protein